MSQMSMKPLCARFPFGESDPLWRLIIASLVLALLGHTLASCDSPESAYRPAFGMVKAYTLLLPMPGAMLPYPEPQYTVPFTIDGASITSPPLAKVKRIVPVRASSAYIAPEYDPAYKTPFATLTAPGSTVPGVGSGTCYCP